MRQNCRLKKIILYTNRRRAYIAFIAFIANVIERFSTLQMTLRVDFIICKSRNVEGMLFEKLFENEINKEDSQFVTRRKKIGGSVYTYLGIGAKI